MWSDKYSYILNLDIFTIKAQMSNLMLDLNGTSESHQIVMQKGVVVIFRN